MKLATEPRSCRIVGIPMKIGMQRTRPTPKRIANLFGGCSSRDAEVGARFIQRHVIAVR